MKIPIWPSVPVEPGTFNGPSERSARALKAVVAQFCVETNPRYEVRDTSGDGRADTFCNIFLWDCTTALRCEIPHWWQGSELSANATIDWLVAWGREHGWRECSHEQAVEAADAGRPAVPTWKSSAGSGHVAILLPSRLGTPMIAQAGRRNLFDAPLRAGFGTRPLRYWTHD